MADPFATGRVTLFAGPRAVAATFVPADGAAVPVRVIRHEPTGTLPIGSTALMVDTTTIDVMRSAVQAPREGDAFHIGTEVLLIEGEPHLDDMGQVWRCEAPPEG